MSWPKAIMVARTSAISQERESEFHDWYDNDHFKEILAFPGFVSARRFAMSNSQVFPQSDKEAAILAIYEIEVDDVEEFAKALAAYAGNPGFTMSSATSEDPPARYRPVRAGRLTCAAPGDPV